MKQIIYFFLALFCMFTILITDSSSTTLSINNGQSSGVASQEVMKDNSKIVLSLISIFCFMGIFTESIKETIEKNTKEKQQESSIGDKESSEKSE
ncbi:hypothetical protein [Clostridium hydrogeniformans]|uniref:hypothetical protein n=1 Tax=Clostridium hydrogeniformans TaxID=349933 RepID=UPI000485916D|nr:hypothetical protein [Clostridium hydrogeniformans]